MNSSLPPFFAIYQTTVKPGWIDYNNHLTEGYYGVVLADAVDAVLHHVGFDAAYRERTNGTIYTVETHVIFLREVKVGATLRFETRLLGVDAKRLHAYTEMYEAEAGYLAATQEGMYVHVDQSLGKVVEMPASLLTPLLEIADRHAKHPRPKYVGRAINSLT